MNSKTNKDVDYTVRETVIWDEVSVLCWSVGAALRYNPLDTDAADDAVYEVLGEERPAFGLDKFLKDVG
jgi:hypothetical protein